MVGRVMQVILLYNINLERKSQCYACLSLFSIPDSLLQHLPQCHSGLGTGRHCVHIPVLAPTQTF